MIFLFYVVSSAVAKVDEKAITVKSKQEEFSSIVSSRGDQRAKSSATNLYVVLLPGN